MKPTPLFDRPQQAPSPTPPQHPFTPGEDGMYCVHCALPKRNQRHRDGLVMP